MIVNTEPQSYSLVAHFILQSNTPPVLEQIRSLGDLPPGWNFGTGRPPSQSVVEQAEKLAAVALAQGLDSLAAFPGTDGQITIVIYLGKVTHSFQIQADGLSIRYWDEADANSDDEIIPLSSIPQKIGTISWSLFFTYICGFGIQQPNNSGVKLLNPLATAVGSRSSTCNVFNKPAPQSVITHDDFTPQSVPNRLYSGDSSRQQPSRKAAS